MPTYQTEEDGSLTINGSNIPNSEDNKDYRAAMKLVNDGRAEIIPYTKPLDARTVSDLRQERYVKEIPLWDMLDALASAANGDKRELDVLAVKISAIKSDIPKV